MTIDTVTALRGFDLIVDRLRERGPGREFGNEARTRCPAHEGSNPTSLSIYRKVDRAKIVCHVVCEDVDVLDVLGLGIPDLFDDPQQPGDVVHRVPPRAPRTEPPKSVVDRALQRLLSLPDFGERLVQCIARQDAIAAARHAAMYWLRRADRFAQEGRHQTALACRNKAAFLL